MGNCIGWFRQSCPSEEVAPVATVKVSKTKEYSKTYLVEQGEDVGRWGWMHWSAGTAAAPVMYCSWLSPSTIVEIHQHTFGFSRGTSSLGTRSSDKKKHRTRSSDTIIGRSSVITRSSYKKASIHVSVPSCSNHWVMEFQQEPMAIVD